MKRNKNHGLKYTKEYSTWRNIKTRCYNVNVTGYKYYGDRGITISDLWIEDPISFIEYIKSLPDYGMKNYTLDRINNDGNYEPGNLRWASKTVQANNQRRKVNHTSKYIGVFYHKKNKKWVIVINSENHNIYLGSYNCETKAALVRDKYIKEHNLKNKLNFNG